LSYEDAPDGWSSDQNGGSAQRGVHAAAIEEDIRFCSQCGTWLERRLVRSDTVIGGTRVAMIEM